MEGRGGGGKEKGATSGIHEQEKAHRGRTTVNSEQHNNLNNFIN